MKKIIAALLLLPCLAFGAANDLVISQRNALDTGSLSRTVNVPTGGQSGLMGFNGSTVLPVFYSVGSGLSLSGGVLSAVPMAVTWESVTGKPSFSVVATSGGYADLTGKPALFSGSYSDLSGKPSLFSGNYSDLAGKPSLSAVAISGAYADLLGRPAIPAAQVQSDWSAVSGLSAIANKPTLFSGAYSALNGIPATFAPAAHTQAFSTITNTPTTQAGYGITDGITAASLSTTLGGYATSGALSSGLATKFNIPTGTTTQYLRGDGSLATLPAGSGGTVTSIIAGTGLSGGTITSSGTISLPATGTAGTYASVTTDAQGRVTAGNNLVINDGPARSLVTTTAATGFQVSPTRIAQVCYEGSVSTTSTIGGPSSASVFLETADTNSTTPGDWTVRAQQTYSNTITLAIVLNQVQSNNWAFCRYIPAGKYVRIRSGGITGTASVAINSSQQEVLQ